MRTTVAARVPRIQNYLRRLALHYWNTNANDTQENNLSAWCAAHLDVNNLDIFRQKELQQLTHDLLQVAAKPQWIYSTAMTALCRSYFPDLKCSPNAFVTDAMREQVKAASDGTRNYLCYVLWTWPAAMGSRRRCRWGTCWSWVELLELRTEFEAILRKELKPGARELKLLKRASHGRGWRR